MAQTFPSRTDYLTAMRRMDLFVLDSDLRHGTPRCLDGVSVAQGGEPLLYSGTFAAVFVVETGDRVCALRCWTMNIGDAAQRYEAVSNCLQTIRSPYFTDFQFVPQGILVDSVRYPTLRMGWVEAGSLRKFLGAHQGQPEVIATAAEEFLRMAASLHAHGVAHCDLQSDNIKVWREGDRVRICLIDYDTMFVPALNGMRITNVGLPAYQHPSRHPSSPHVAESASAKDDYFSELVIYLTLLALAEDPALWEDYRIGAGDKHLLFTAEDLSEATPSELFQRLRRGSEFVSRLTLVLWNFCRCPNIEVLIALEEVVQICRAAQPARPAAQGFEALLKSKQTGGPAPATGGGGGNGSGWLQEWTLGARHIRTPEPPLPPVNPNLPTPSFSFAEVLRNRSATTPRDAAATPPPLPPPIKGKPVKSAEGLSPGRIFFLVLAAVLILLWLFSAVL